VKGGRVRDREGAEEGERVGKGEGSTCIFVPRYATEQ